ncbi:S41 family peptidase [Croceitalea rosinachiae]|uniref:S41 family peptidase n=1 Tax=Croceitalea rosinachiae TaxID=3075596 RepID=A0ABU3A7M1_9FLAO|nr:S41 family peptidase [Croceitalea sp. F388]MDT0605825.1 S41 family peptidase [Croceitalea sp. F388]
MKLLLEKLTRSTRQSNLPNDIAIAIPRVFCGLLLAFSLGASKFGMPWSPEASNLSLFEVSDWFVEDVSNFGGIFAALPLLFAWLAAASEAIGGLCLALGLKTRVSSFFLIVTMLVAIFFQQWDNGLWAMLPALGFLWVSLYNLIMGSGRLGLDYIISNRLKNDRLLTTPINQINGRVKTVGHILVFLMICTADAQEKNVSFKVDTKNFEDVNTVSIRGNIAPLSQKEDYKLVDNDGDGVYEASIDFNTSKRNVKFKFLINGQAELQGSDNRVIWFKDEPVSGNYIYNEFNYYNQEELDKLVFTDKQIEEDIAVLKEIVQYIHPNVYKFRDSIALQEDFQLLEEEMKRNPELTKVYGAVSKFAAKIKCSHTFTNPWNQGGFMEKANFYHPDKIPFTFNRIGKRLFIDKNASENTQLRKGLEIITINHIATDDVLSRLAEYVTSDGNNYEKKLERLAVTGEEKFSMFDIFYPIEFGTQKTFSLRLKDLNTGKESQAVVNSISKTNRTKLLIERYGKLDTSVKDGWNFEIINKDIARLSIKSFSVHRNEFDWKAYLDNVFIQLNDKSIPNFIIDIRGNEGGQGEVGQYILERVVQKQLKVTAMQSSVRYLNIPSGFKNHINTWAKFPYDFNGKIETQKEGRYFLKEKYSVGEKIMKPKKDNYNGKVFLMTDASNSSATHLMATYAKQMDNITLVGQETGGNQLGTNGGYMFFLRLPNTKVELDIPVIHQYVPTSQKPIDGGVKPHISIEKNAQDFINNQDTELNTLITLIKTK